MSAFTTQELEMQVDTSKMKAIAEAVGASDFSVDAILAAAKAKKYILKQFSLTFDELKKAARSLRSNAASINGNASKMERLITERGDVIDTELNT